MMRTSPVLALCALASLACAAGEELDPGFFQNPVSTTGTTSSGGGQAGATTAVSGSGGETTSGTTSSSAIGSGGADSTGAAGSSTMTGGSTSSAGSAGSVGVGGSAGSGGAVGSGGSTGTGGSLADAGPDRVIPPTTGVAAFYHATNVGLMADSILCEIDVRNMSTETIPLTDLTIRYYFTDEVATGPTVDINYAHVTGPPYRELGSNGITHQVQKIPLNMQVYNKADSYIELGFAAGSGSLVPKDDALIAMKYHASDYKMINQANDYSFDPSKTTLAAWDHIVLLRAGTVIWGIVPAP